MAAKPVALELTILRKGKPEDTIDVTADPADTGLLRQYLVDWLTGHKWSKARWPEFELVAREAGRYKQLAKVRAGG
jgi:hypothetical protein